MDNPSDDAIRDIFAAPRVIAVVGASANPARPSYGVARFLQSRGHRVIPVNPGLAGQTLLGEAVHADLASIPEAVDIVDIFRSSEAVPGIIEAALARSPLPRVIWMQLGVAHPVAAERAAAAGLTVVQNRCPKIEYDRLDL